MSKSKTIKTANRATCINSAQPIEPNDPHVIAARDVLAAQGQAENALISAILLGISDGRFTPEHLTMAGYPAGTAKTYASEWNTGASVAAILGDKATVKLVRDTVKAYPAGQYRAVLAALRAVRNDAKARSIKTANAAQVKALVKDAPKAAQIADDKRRDALAKARTGSKASAAGKRISTATAQVAASRSYTDAAAALLLIANTLATAEVPEGREAQAAALLRAVQDACEAGAPFRRKVVKA